MEKEIEAVTGLIDFVIEFAVAYGFQVLGALVVLVIGIKVAGWSGRRVTALCLAKNMDETLAKFMGSIVKVIVVAFVLIITLGNFGVSIAPLIALAGASAFGLTLALQGPLSNYGAGLSIMITRPFVVGNTITVKKFSGVVDEVKLAATVLVGEDGEKITIPNKEIVGEVIVNSEARRVVETRIAISDPTVADQAIQILEASLKKLPEVDNEPAPQIGIHDFTYGGVVIGLRFWVPSLQYFQSRYAINRILLKDLNDAGVSLATSTALSVPVQPLSADEPEPA